MQSLMIFSENCGQISIIMFSDSSERMIISS